MARTTRDFDKALAQTRKAAAKHEQVAYMVPGVYGWGVAWTASAVDAKWVEVQPDGSAVAVETRWENSGKVEVRTNI